MMDPCPTHTVSAPGSYSRLSCQCMPGYQCTYYKQISAIVYINSTYSAFTSNLNNVQTNFISAMSTAANVSADQVNIISVVAGSLPSNLGNRRLLEASHGLVEVHTTIHGTGRLRHLDKYMKSVVSTTWHPSHKIHAVEMEAGSKQVARQYGRGPPPPTSV